MKISTKDFFSKCEQLRSFLQVWLNLLKKSLMKNFIFYAVLFIISQKHPGIYISKSSQCAAVDLKIFHNLLVSHCMLFKFS